MLLQCPTLKKTKQWDHNFIPGTLESICSRWILPVAAREKHTVPLYPLLLSEVEKWPLQEKNEKQKHSYTQMAVTKKYKISAFVNQTLSTSASVSCTWIGPERGRAAAKFLTISPRPPPSRRNLSIQSLAWPRWFGDEPRRTSHPTHWNARAGRQQTQRPNVACRGE